MTYHLVHADQNTLLASDRAVIKHAERIDFADAVALLHAAAAIREKTQADAKAVRSAGHAEGLAEARAAADDHVAEQISQFARALEQHEQARRSDIAEAAHAAVRAIIGELDDATILPRMVERTLARLPAEGPVSVAVAPAMAARLAERLAGMSHVAIVAEPALAPTDCVMRTSAGQVIASLSVQLDALAKRWGVAG
jgi:flagellar biosynthesis/type III secretory pathway protein FliH